MSIRVIIADDHEMFREGLAVLLKRKKSEIELCGQAVDGQQALDLVLELMPDMVIIDQTMPKIKGIDVISLIKKRKLPIKCIILTMHTDPGIAKIALDRGADGFVVKESAFDELLDAVEIVMRGERFISPIVKAGLDELLQNESPENRLTPREKEILSLVARGLTNRQIAKRLFISIKTVDTHRSRIMRKLDLHTAAALTHYAVKNDLI